MEMRQIAAFSDKLKMFVQSGNYEPYILALMNQSELIFPSQYAANEEQAHSQCDFYDIRTSEKYEAKLPFDKKEGQLICSNSADLKEWLEFMLDEESEFSDRIVRERGKYRIDGLKLYQTLEKPLKTVQEDENAIILFPYPITLDMEGNGNLNLLHFCGDILSSIFGELVHNGVVGTRKIYVIYPSMDNKIVLRCLNTNHREYLVSQELNGIFSYSFFCCKK